MEQAEPKIEWKWGVLAALAMFGPSGIGGFHVLVPVGHERAARELLGTEDRRR